MAAARITKTQLKTIAACLDAGIPLTTRLGRRFVAGQITGALDRGWALTTHLTEDLRSYVTLSPDAVAYLAQQAAANLARKDAILAEQAAAHAVAMGRA